MKIENFNPEDYKEILGPLANMFQKLVGPGIEEIGQGIGDSIRLWRFKKQVKLLSNVKAYLEKHNIKANTIPLKILFPLLDGASLEEDEDLSKMWEALTINYCSKAENLKSSVYPYILSQISSNEAQGIEFIKNWNAEKIELASLNNIADLDLEEISNLIRLGIIKQLPPDIIQIPDGSPKGTIFQLGAEKSVYGSSTYFQMTDLGLKFIEACKFPK